MRPRSPFSRPRALALAALAALGLALPAQADPIQDPWLTTKVKMALLTDEVVNALDVDVDTTEGRVTLHGTVANGAEKARAESLARNVEGVRAVRNQLIVASDAREAERTAPKRSDAELRQQVETVLSRDQALADSDIRVASVDEGVVVLEGRAASLSAHRRALEDARAVRGVRAVRSEIEAPDRLAEGEGWREQGEDAAESVTAAARDLWITGAAKMRLVANEQVDALDVNVDTRDGVVTLFGTVESEAARTAAEREVAQVSGVTRVENALRVARRPQDAAADRSDDGVAARE